MCLGTQAVRTEGPIPSPYLFTGINGDSVKSKFLSAKVKSCCSEGESPSGLAESRRNLERKN
jgi:hypothetical protein